MNIAICSMGELFGGVERHILDLCRFYARRGLPAPLVILFHDRDLARLLRDQGVEPVVVRGRNRYDWALVRRVAALLRDHRSDVVHAHGYKATIACGLATRGTACRVIKTEHGKLEATVRQPLSWVKSRLSFALEQGVTRRRVDHVCYVTRDIARFYEQRHRGLPRSVVPNGIDPLDPQAFPRPADLPEGTFNVGIVGRISSVKGIPFAVEALGRPAVPADVHLRVLGTGPQSEEITALAERCGLSARVHLLGFRDNIYDYLAHLDVLLMPSLHEGLPYTLLEAWSLGCPIIASRVGGLAEVLSPGPGVTLVPVGDVDAIAAALTDARRAAAGGHRPALAPCPYTLDRMGGAYLDIMTGLAGATATPRAEGGP